MFTTTTIQILLTYILLLLNDFTTSYMLLHFCIPAKLSTKQVATLFLAEVFLSLLTTFFNLATDPTLHSLLYAPIIILDFGMQSIFVKVLSGQFTIPFAKCTLTAWLTNFIIIIICTTVSPTQTSLLQARRYMEFSPIFACGITLMFICAFFFSNVIVQKLFQHLEKHTKLFRTICTLYVAFAFGSSLLSMIKDSFIIFLPTLITLSLVVFLWQLLDALQVKKEFDHFTQDYTFVQQQYENIFAQKQDYQKQLHELHKQIALLSSDQTNLSSKEKAHLQALFSNEGPAISEISLSGHLLLDSTLIRCQRNLLEKDIVFTTVIEPLTLSDASTKQTAYLINEIVSILLAYGQSIDWLQLTLRKKNSQILCLFEWKYENSNRLQQALIKLQLQLRLTLINTSHAHSLSSCEMKRNYGSLLVIKH